jgi:DNA polymerase I-like protein with 3'-5' exonuclease and polymerase domains
VLVQLDFISLEPRVARALMDCDSIDGDIYQCINKALFAGDLNRAQVKIATLCALYGVSVNKLRDMMGGIGDAKKVIRKIREFFDVHARVKIMKRQLEECGFLQNFFGRPLFFKNPADHVLFSHFIQSTAVDVAMLGFASLRAQMKAKKIHMNPFFIIHDALILEIETSAINNLRELCHVGIDIEGLGNFPLSLQVLSGGDK